MEERRGSLEEEEDFFRTAVAVVLLLVVLLILARRDCRGRPNEDTLGLPPTDTGLLLVLVLLLIRSLFLFEERRPPSLFLRGLRGLFSTELDVGSISVLFLLAESTNMVSTHRPNREKERESGVGCYCFTSARMMDEWLIQRMQCDKRNAAKSSSITLLY